ncbi:MAG: DUF1223 domain-containing protein [Halofilum sp. (in: g-proteobacteria)]|nr:DUF1223 domain-containing protein [Halofilum sp. (in: g-proteobacteria)]
MPPRHALAVTLAALTLLAAPPGATARGEAATVVELFTSQGCSSCPPADALLGRLADAPGVIALSLHVDYWDRLGWTDPFAQAAFSERQRRYARQIEDDNRYTAGVYTPQVVVDGRRAMVGHAAAKVRAALEAARQRPAAVTPRFAGGARVVVPAADGGAPAGVWLLAIDRRHETPVARGENAGRTLVNHRVVRSLERLGTWDGGRAVFDIDAERARAAGRDGLVVVVQRDGPGPILGAARRTLTPR